MDSQFTASREDLYHVQMDVKHVQTVQNNHAERLLRLEKRQADDAALKSVWGPESPFPSVLSGTPQHGPVQNNPTNVFDDFDDEHGQNLLGSLQLEADEEPVRRGASRANSVRFDVSALQGSNWTQGSRSSGEFVRPHSGFGNHPMERSLSHKSDGRHSSTGQSVHSMHSVHSGRTSSLGLDTNFVIGGNEGAPVIVPQPPPGLFVLGSVPAIIRCWLTTNYSHNALLYAVVCTGSQKSIIDYTLIKELGLSDQVSKQDNGMNIIRLPVYLPEAIITQPSSRSNSPASRIPAFTADFEVLDSSQSSSDDTKKIRVCLGSDTLRAHNGDVLLSQNLLSLYADDHDKLSIPLVRPEDENLFKNLRTSNINTKKNKVAMGSFAPPQSQSKVNSSSSNMVNSPPIRDLTQPDKLKSTELNLRSAFSTGPDSPFIPGSTSDGNSPYRIPSSIPGSSTEENRTISERQAGKEDNLHEFSLPDAAASTESSRRESSSGVAWGSWRHGFVSTGGESGRENEPTSRYQKAARMGKNMKVLKPSKSMGPPSSGPNRSSSTVRTGASYEPPAPQRSSGESRRKSQPNSGNENLPPLRWESKTVSSEEQRPAAKNIATVPRSTNPVGGASAFAWMNPKPKTNATNAE